MPAKQKKTFKRRKRGGSDGGEEGERCAEEMVRGIEDGVETTEGERGQRTESVERVEEGGERHKSDGEEMVVESREREWVLRMIR